MDKTIWFRTVCKQNGVDVTDDQIAKLDLFVQVLLDWNKKINLISRKDEEHFWENHILHSVSILFKLELPNNSNILDLGTGGGLPGIPIKILRPDISITLLDSTQKKINVVNEILLSLGLQNAKAVWGRAEDVGFQKEYSGRYDIVVARAVAPLKDLVRWSPPFLKKRTAQEEHQTEAQATRLNVSQPALIALKGGDLEGEIRQVRTNKQIQSIKVIDLALQGSEQFELNDKKVVIVYY